MNGADRSEPTRRPALASSSAWSLVANLAAAGCQWALVAALARMADPAEVGRYALAVALASPPMLLAGLQLRTLVATDASSRFSLDACERLRRRAAGLAMAMVMAMAVAAGARGRALVEVGLVAVIKALEQGAELSHGVLQRQERMRRVAAVWVIKGLGSLLAFVASFRAAGSLGWALAAVAGWQAATLALIDRRAARAATPAHKSCCDLNAAGPRALARRGLALGLVALLISLTASLARWAVERRQGAAALGRLAALACLPLALQAITGAWAQASAARLAAAFLEDRAAFRRLVARLAAAAAVLSAAALAMLPSLEALAGWLYGPSYAADHELLFWLLTAGAIGAVTGVVGTALTAAEVIGSQPALYGVSAVACAAWCYWFVGPERPAAAGEALAIAAAVVALGQPILLDRASGKRRRIDVPCATQAEPG